MKNKLFLSIFFLLLGIYCGFAQSQQIQITGKVLNKADGSPLPFAYVQISELAIGTVTDANGDYNLFIPEQHTDQQLTFSYLGYQQQSFQISKIRNKTNFVVRLKESATLLSEVTIEPRKEISAKKLWKQVVRNISKNYPNEAFNAEGYYRETIQENDAYIRFADAACEFHFLPYRNKNLDKAIRKSGRRRGQLVSSSYGAYWGDRLHRGHFNWNTLPDDQLRIIQVRTSEDLTKKRMYAHVEGGPIGLIGKDRMKYLRYFSNIKNWDKYQFTVKEFQNKDEEWEYVLAFEPIMSAEKLEELQAIKDVYKRMLAVKKAFNRPLAGNIYINQNSFAVTRITYSVPKAYKEFICGFTVMAIKHFDYKVDIDYKKVGDKWFLDHIRQEDEFILVDTTGGNRVTTPYRAVSELFIEKTTTTGVKKFPTEECFANADLNTLYEYPLEYDSAFWKAYTNTHQMAKISTSIRAEMEGKKTLEQQFRDRFIRDDHMLAPIARQEPSMFRIHGKTLVDHYAWLKDTKAPKQNDSIMNYLEAENKYFDNYTIPAKKRQRSIYNELTRRIVKTQESLPTLNNGYWYSRRYEKEDEYPVYYRRKDAPNSPKEVLFDVRKMAKNKGYYSIGGIDVAPNNQLVAFAENTDGTDNSTLRFKDLKTGKLLKDSLLRVASFAWVADSKSFYYSKQAPKSNRSAQIFKHILGTSQQEDELIHDEQDATLEVSVWSTKKSEYIFMSIGNSTSSEMYFKNGDDTGEFNCILPRKKDLIYNVSYVDSAFYILTDWKAHNMRLMRTTPSKLDQKEWETVVPENPDALLIGFKKFKNYLVVQERGNATYSIKVIDLKTNEAHYVKFKNELSMVSLANNELPDTDSLRIRYSSLTETSKVYSYHMESREKRLVWQDTVRFNSKSLVAKRVWAKAKDGTSIPITLVYNKFRRKMGFPFSLDFPIFKFH